MGTASFCQAWDRQSSETSRTLAAVFGSAAPNYGRARCGTHACLQAQELPQRPPTPADWPQLRPAPPSIGSVPLEATPEAAALPPHVAASSTPNPRGAAEATQHAQHAQHARTIVVAAGVAVVALAMAAGLLLAYTLRARRRGGGANRHGWQRSRGAARMSPGGGSGSDGKSEPGGTALLPVHAERSWRQVRTPAPRWPMQPQQQGERGERACVRLQAKPAAADGGGFTVMHEPIRDNASSAEDLAPCSMRLHGASSKGSSSIADRGRRGSLPSSAMNSAFEYALPKELSLLPRSAITESGTHVDMEIGNRSEHSTSSGMHERSAALLRGSSWPGAAASGALRRAAAGDTDSLGSTTGGFSDWGNTRHVYIPQPEIMHAAQASSDALVRMSSSADVHGTPVATRRSSDASGSIACAATGSRRLGGARASSSISIPEIPGELLRVAQGSGSAQSRGGGPMGDPFLDSAGTAAAGGSPTDGRLRGVMRQLDTFGPEDLFLGRFRMLGQKERRRGGAILSPPHRAYVAGGGAVSLRLLP